MKIINIILFLLFACFAFVQYDDPDSFLWIMIYGIVALISLFRVFGLFRRQMVFLLLIVIGLYTLLHAPSFWQWLMSNDKQELFGDMIYDKPYIEGTREFLGLVLADLSLAFHLYWQKV